MRSATAMLRKGVKMKRKLVRKKKVAKMVTMYNIECSSSGSNKRCTPGC